MFDFRKMQTSLIPFPRLHFFAPHFLESKIDDKVDRLTSEAFGEEVFDKGCCLSDIKEDRGRILTYYCGVRTGSKKVSERFVHDQLNRY